MNHTNITTRHVLLSGPPGIGKTTLVKKICEKLRERNVPIKGFYTEELREGGKRTGFDVVSLEGPRAPLARLVSGCLDARYKPKVGPYAVHVESFEGIALPLLKQAVVGGVTVIDEIGKMEMYSKRFQESVVPVFNTPSSVVLAVIHQSRGPDKFTSSLRSHSGVKVLEVNKGNRDTLSSQILQILEIALALH